MEHYDVRRFALALAIQAEIEGMKSENMQRQAVGSSMAYTEESFSAKADDLRNLAYCHDDQL